MEGVYNLSGKIFRIDEVRHFKNDFRKRLYFVETKREYNGKEYSDIIKLVADGKRCDAIEALSIGQDVEVGFTLTGRMWKPADKDEEINFTELKTVWVQGVGSTGVHSPEETSNNTAQSIINNMTDNAAKDDLDPLPF